MLIAVAVAVVAWRLFSSRSPVPGETERSTVASTEVPCDPELTRVEEVAGLAVAYPECYESAGSTSPNDRFHGLTLTDPGGMTQITVAITVVPPERWDRFVSGKREMASGDCRITDDSGWQVWRCPSAAYRSIELVGHNRTIAITAVLPDDLLDTDLATFVADVFERMVARLRAQAPEAAP